MYALSSGDFQLVLTEELRERNMGHLQGMRWDDAFVQNPGAFKGFSIFEPKSGLNFDDRDQEIPVRSAILQINYTPALCRAKW